MDLCRFRSLSVVAILLITSIGGCAMGGGSPPPPFQTVPSVREQASDTRLYYVDGTLQTSPCPAYNTSTQSCGDGRDLAFDNLADANGIDRAGDTIEIRAGHYLQPIRPANSGTSKSPLIYRSYMNEAVTVKVAEEPALQLIRVQHVTVESIHFDKSLGWGRLEDSHHNRIVGNTFTEALARGTTGGLKLVRSHYNRVEGNSFYRGNDSIVIQDSGHNLISGNHLEFARHSLISVRCGNYNVIRANYLHNARQKAGEIYDCEGVSDAPIKYDVSKRNLWEFNHFAHVTGSSEPDNFNGIQYVAQTGIVRHNWFIDNQGGAMHLAIYAEEALYVYGNRIYGNRFINNRCHALSAGDLPPLRAGDNRIHGNVFAANRDCRGTSERVASHPLYTLVENIETAQDVGTLPEVWLATTPAAGTGSTLLLDDVLPFFDGHNITGEVGDEIELRSSRQRARVTAIDFTTKSLTLNRPITWAAGDGVRVIASDPAARPGPQRTFTSQ